MTIWIFESIDFETIGLLAAIRGLVLTCAPSFRQRSRLVPCSSRKFHLLRLKKRKLCERQRRGNCTAVESKADAFGANYHDMRALWSSTPAAVATCLAWLHWSLADVQLVVDIAKEGLMKNVFINRMMPKTRFFCSVVLVCVARTW